ncbi:hypothetical protein [Corynebacterium cystitidis]|uniref:hypothetical protein n=1 Tax=Corynebacterium cystitidis TaxID=35757 RepID=UPI00211DAC16|nr:hypothetical protein [Corynebacterium cystitidis]
MMGTKWQWLLAQDKTVAGRRFVPSGVVTVHCSDVSFSGGAHQRRSGHDLSA